LPYPKAPSPAAGFGRGGLAAVTSSLRPATRSPGSSSLEVSVPFSAINAVSPFLDAGQPRLLAVYVAPAAGLPHPQHFRLQGFPPSWRLSPHSTSPVCFTRQAPMGFRAFQSTFVPRCRPKTAWPPLLSSESRANPRSEHRTMTLPRPEVRKPRDAVSNASVGPRGSSRPLPFRVSASRRGDGSPSPPLLLRGQPDCRRSGTWTG
jgi:hypothetical protein